MDSVIPRKKVFIPRHSEVHGRVNSEARNGNTQWKICLRNSQNNLTKWLVRTSKVVKGFRREFPSVCLFHNGIPSYFLFRGMVRNGIREIALIFVTRKGIPSICLFRGMVRKESPRVCFYLCSTVENSEHFSLPGNGSERNSDSFLFRGTAGIPPEQTSCSVYFVFRGIIFFVGNC